MLEINEKNIALLSKIGPNGALGIAADELGAENDKIFFLTADLGVFSGLSRFAEHFPDRYFNTGIAEQNMLGVTAGIAAEGKRPYAVTYASFAAMRCADQVRVCLGEMRLPVNLIGVGAGLSVGLLGPTHMALEDVAVMRAIPGIAVISPADGLETIKAVHAAAKKSGSVYLRLTGISGNAPVYKQDYVFEIGKAVELLPNGDVAIIATGSMVHTALKVAEILGERGISCGVADMHTIRPLDTGAIDSACAARLVVTVEEHFITGGLGSAVAEYLCEKNSKPPLLRIGVHSYPHADTYKNLLQQCGLTSDSIAEKIIERIKNL